jgi:hypothetical protein
MPVTLSWYCTRIFVSYLFHAYIPYTILYNCYPWSNVRLPTYFKWMLLHAVVHALVYTPICTRMFGEPMDKWPIFNFDTILLIIFVNAHNAHQKLKHF